MARRKKHVLIKLSLHRLLSMATVHYLIKYEFAQCTQKDTVHRGDGAREKEA